MSSDVLAHCSLYCEILHCRSAQYYVDLLKLIAKEGSMSVLHDERERLLIIMESVGKLTKLIHEKVHNQSCFCCPDVIHKLLDRSRSRV